MAAIRETDQPRAADARTARGGQNGAAGGPLLRCDHVQLGYWGNRGFNLAVADATFEVAAREKVIVIGQSGGGKSTLLKAVAGFIAPVGGSISVAGRTSLTPGPDRAVVFQEFDQLFPWRTVLDNVAYPLRVNGASRREAEARARDHGELPRLTGSADRYVRWEEHTTELVSQ